MMPSDVAGRRLATSADAATFFAERRKRTDFEAFDRLMSLTGSEPQPAGEEIE